MKDKKAIRKNIIILIIIIIGSTVLWFSYPFMQVCVAYILSPKPELQVKIEKYIEEYNRNCDTDDKIKIAYYHENGPQKDCKFEFSDSQAHNDDSVVSFFLKFHNDFGYDYLCNDEIEKDYFTEYGVQEFTLENIRMSYGKRMTVPEEVSGKIDAKICSIGKKITVDQETIGKFKGIVYVYSREDIVIEQ
jgi:hypothetical protein